MAAMRRPDLGRDPRFSTPGARRVNLEELKQVVQAWMWSFPDMAALDAQLDEAKIAIGEVRSLEDIAGSEWAEYWTATHEVSDRNGSAFKLPGRPWKFSEAELPLPGDPALQGENNVEVLKTLGYDNTAIQQMEESGALVGNFASSMIASVMAQVSGAAPSEEESATDQTSETDDA